MQLKPKDYMNIEWEKINEARRQFQDFINYEWNYAVHLSFHKNYETNTKTTEKIVKAYLKDLRKEKKVLLTAFYIIPKSFVDPEFNPHHIHILLLIFNERERMKIILKDSTTKFYQINKCEVHELYMPESGYYVTKFKNLKLTDFESFHFDFYKKQLLERYGTATDFINDELRRAFQRKSN